MPDFCIGSDSSFEMTLAYMCSIFRGGSCFVTVPSFEMALVCMCSILRGGSCSGTVPSFEMAFVDLRRDKSFLFQKRLPPPKLLFLRGFIVLM